MATPKKVPTKKTTKATAKPAAKKPAVKKTVAAKTVAKTKVAAKPVASKVPATPVKAKTKPAATGWWGWLLAVLLGGALLGALLSDPLWLERFEDDQGMVVIDDTTWMPVGGTPVSVVVLNDENCGAACNVDGALDALRTSVTPALKVNQVDISSPKGQILLDQFELVSVPQFFFLKDITELEVTGPEGEEVRFIDNLPEGILTEKEGLYHIEGSRVGFKPGKFVTPPEFADLDVEPVQGNGPVQVVEFTDLQCPYCKRFYDQNKDLLARYVEEGAITYVVKDFPLNFHKEAYEGMHKALNCAQQAGGNEAYFAVKDDIFANQTSFNGIGAAAAEDLIAGYATDRGVDIAACLADSGTVEAEILADIAEGARYGVSGTPAVFVGTQILPGAVGPAVVEAAIKAELGE